MSTLPYSPNLGQLEVVEVYEYYDRPVLFACKNQLGVIFLVVCIDEDKDGDTWLYAPLSHNRFTHIRSGAIDLHTAFSKVEGGFLYLVRTPFMSNIPLEIDIVRSETLADDQLPVQGERLQLETKTIPDVIDNAVIRARQTRREQVDLSIETFIQERTEAPAGQLGEVLKNFQHLINTIGNKLFGTGVIKGAFPQKTVADMQLNVIGFGAGSFKTIMGSSSVANLFDETNIGEALSVFVSLLQVSQNNEELHTILKKFGTRVSSAFIDFLESINLDLTGVRIEWGSPHPDRGGSATITSEMAQKTVYTIKTFEEQSSREFEVSSTLIGANLRTMKFEIEVGESSFAGDIDEIVKESITGAILGNTYRATLREVAVYKPIVEGATLKYYLIALRMT